MGVSRFGLFATAWVLCSNISLAQQRDFEQSVNEIIRQHRIPALSLAYFDDGTIHSLQAWVESNVFDSEIDDQTIFSAASLSKPITAYITLRLMEQGKIHLDTPLAEYHDYEDLISETGYGRVTPRMVLTHTSGLPNWREGDLRFIHTPGLRFSYSGEGFYWLQQVLEHIENKAFEAIAEEWVFEPLAMNRSSFVWEGRFEGNYAIPQNIVMFPSEKWKPASPNAAGSLQTTATDYAKFLQELAEPKFITIKTRDAMLSSQVLVKSYEKGQQTVSWGLGIGIQETAEGRECWHWGNNGNVRSYFAYSLARKKGVIYLTNSKNGLAMTNKITDLFLGTDQPGYRWNGFKSQGKWYRIGAIFKRKNVVRAE